MSRLNYDDDILRAKKVFKIFEKKQNDTYNFKKNIHYLNYSKSKKNTKNTEVVIKITSSCKNIDGIKNHLKYISRNGKLTLIDSENNELSDKDNYKIITKNFNTDGSILTQREIRNFRQREYRETYNMVFSMKDIELAPIKKIREAAIKTIKEKYPDNYFVIAMHDDTDNPHCHICLKSINNNGKRIDIKKSDLNQLRKNFAKELRALNIEATATIKKKIELNTGKEIDKDLYIKDDMPTKFEKHKAHHYRVINFGEANYKFDKDKPMSYFVRYRTKNGNDVEIWSNDLERVIKENDIKKDEYCRFAITSEEPVIVKERRTYKQNGQEYTTIVDKKVYKKKWDVSVEKRAEKILNPLKKFTPAETFVENEYPSHKANHYEVLSYGKTNYKFNINNKDSYYVKCKNEFGKEFEIWNKDLERVIKENGITMGDYCKFVVVDEKPFKTTIIDDKGTQYIKTNYKKIFDVSVENKNEKNLKPIISSKPKYEIKKIDAIVSTAILEKNTSMKTGSNKNKQHGIKILIKNVSQNKNTDKEL